MKPCNQTLSSALGWYAGAPSSSPSMSIPNSAQLARSKASTNSATNRAGWSGPINSSRVGGNIHICSRTIGRFGISITSSNVATVHALNPSRQHYRNTGHQTSRHQTSRLLRHPPCPESSNPCNQQLSISWHFWIPAFAGMTGCGDTSY